MITCSGYIVMGFRLRYLLDNRIGFGTGVGGALLALGLNNILPARLGEIAKVVYLQQRSRVSVGVAVGVVFWERFFDVNVLALLALGTFWWHAQPELMAPMAGALLGLWCGVIFALRWAGLATRLINRLPIVSLRTFLHDIHGHIRTGVRPKMILVLAVFTCTLWGIYTTQTMLAMVWVAMLPITLDQAIMVFVVAAVGIALPAAPGGLGVFEAAIVLAPSWYGIEKEAALALALLCRVAQFLPPTLAALLILACSDISLRSLRQTAKSPAAPSDTA